MRRLKLLVLLLFVWLWLPPVSGLISPALVAATLAPHWLLLGLSWAFYSLRVLLLLLLCLWFRIAVALWPGLDGVDRIR